MRREDEHSSGRSHTQTPGFCLENNTLLPFFSDSRAAHLSKKSAAPPLMKKVPEPQRRNHKSFHGKVACLVYGLVFMLNDEYEMMCYSSVYEKEL